MPGRDAIAAQQACFISRRKACLRGCLRRDVESLVLLLPRLIACYAKIIVMFKPDKLDEHLEKLRRRSGQTESQIEQDLLDLFHEALGI
jgi:hypothetical protein